MSRLTEKVNYGSSWVEEIIETDEYIPLNYSTDTTIGKCVDKLGRLEDLEDELKVPLEFILMPYYLSDLKKVWYHNQWCDVVRVVAYEEATTPYMEVRCKDYDYLKFIPLDNYKKTFWLKEDKSE